MRILVADDHSLFRDGIISLLEAGGLQVIGQAGDGQSAVEQALRLKPDLVLLDINMPGMDGIKALQAIKSELPETKVVMLTVLDDEENLIHAIQAGADGYLLKHLNGVDFLQMLLGLERGEAAITRAMATRLLKHIGKTKGVHQAEQVLSEREIDVLRFVADGKSNRYIAEKLSVSENTIKFHLKNILQKLGVSNRTEAVTHAIQNGLL